MENINLLKCVVEKAIQTNQEIKDNSAKTIDEKITVDTYFRLLGHSSAWYKFTTRNIIH